MLFGVHGVEQGPRFVGSGIGHGRIGFGRSACRFHSSFLLCRWRSSRRFCCGNSSYFWRQLSSYRLAPSQHRAIGVACLDSSRALRGLLGLGSLCGRNWRSVRAPVQVASSAWDDQGRRRRATCCRIEPNSARPLPSRLRRRIAAGRSRTVQHGAVIVRGIQRRLGLGLLGGLLGQLLIQRHARLPLPRRDPTSLHFLRSRHREQPHGLAILRGFVHGLRLNGHGSRIRRVKTRIVVMAVDPQRHRDQPRAASRQKFNDSDRARAACLLFRDDLRLVVVGGRRRADECDPESAPRPFLPSNSGAARASPQSELSSRAESAADGVEGSAVRPRVPHPSVFCLGGDFRGCPVLAIFG